ncbi:plastocyanin/azurin family copper-binding protein [Halorubellus sp. PRR65]|uniref:plastocyanin/azurin family copper-binding protein n=1 Tax=Halorubellus sp. PRR65 TaxID=3098148 RepID=UPI002B2595D0|nr:plastocyanin/azurin family copper-binding protein [Halorubellus sp. PRR65]
MTDRETAPRIDDGAESDARDASDRGGCDHAERDHGRRRVLAVAGASLSALATAGCLSNPWGPARPGARSSTATADGGESAPATATTRGSEPTTDADADTTRVDATSGDDGDTTVADETTEATTTEPTATETATAVPPEEREPDQVVEVAPDGFRFAPETFTIDAGDTVHWQWKDSGHNVRVREKPDASDWTGTPGDASDTYGEGYLHAHTFDEPGEYECFCAPHQTLGLEGSFTVR